MPNLKESDKISLKPEPGPNLDKLCPNWDSPKFYAKN